MGSAGGRPHGPLCVHIKPYPRCHYIQSPTAHREQHPDVKVAGRLKNPVTQLAPLGLKQACTGATGMANLHPDPQTFGVLEVRSEQLGFECIM